MKNGKHRIKSLLMATIMIVNIVASSTIQTLAATKLYKNYETMCIIPSKFSCTSMQGMAVGNTYIYTVKRNSEDTQAILYRTHRTSGKTDSITDGSNTTFSCLEHANDMDVIGLTLNGVRRSHLFVAGMTSGENCLIRMTIKASETKGVVVAKYRLKYKDKYIVASGVSIVETTKNNIVLLIKNGNNFYRAVVPRNDDKAFGPNESSKVIDVSLWFKISRSSMSIKGKNIDFTNYSYQSCEYHNGKVFVPMAGKGDYAAQSIILVYDLPSKQHGKQISNNSDLSFMFSGTELFEVESCGINSKTGEMYFNTNKKGGDGIHRVKECNFK